MQPQQYYSYPSLTRYFDHIQHRPAIREPVDSQAPILPIIVFDLAGAPKSERKPQQPKKKEKAVVSDQAASAPKASKAKKDVPLPAVAAEGQDSPASAEGKQQRKEKKEKKKPNPAGNEAGKAGGGSKAAAEDSGEPVPSMLDLRVGHIVDGKFSMLVIDDHTSEH
jgi:aminoacyl tRNA synthase complex-interacting multifunctional protein 1